MIILAVLKDEVRAGQRRAAGKQVRERIAIGVDRFNLVIATTTADIFIGQKFFGKFEHLFLYLPEFGINEEFARKSIIAALERALEISIDSNLTPELLDKTLEIPRRTTDSAGELQLYRTLKKRWAGQRNVEDGDLILWQAEVIEEKENTCVNS